MFVFDAMTELRVEHCMFALLMALPRKIIQYITERLKEKTFATGVSASKNRVKLKLTQCEKFAKSYISTRFLENLMKFIKETE